MDRLRRMQNNLMRVILQSPLLASATASQQKLHWLPVRQRVVFKLAMLTFKAKNLGQLVYLSSLLNEYQLTIYLPAQEPEVGQVGSRELIYLFIFVYL